MKKEEILKKLDELNLEKIYIVITDDSLVLQNIFEKTEDIDIACSKNIMILLIGMKRKVHTEFLNIMMYLNLITILIIQKKPLK